MRICSLEARGCRGAAGRPGSCTGAGQGKHDVSRAAVSDDCEVAVIGAGPYGLAVAAHLRSAGIGTRVLGRTMSFWREHTAAGCEASVPGLHFAGASAVDSHGPLLRFVAGAGYAARSITRSVTCRALAHRRRARPAGLSQAGSFVGSRRISHSDLGMGPAE
jgi:hypothetical protein